MSDQLTTSLPNAPATALPAPRDELLKSAVSANPTDDLATQLPLSLREVSAVALLIALGDLTLYRGSGFAGLSLFLLGSPWLLLLGCPRPRISAGFWIVGGMTLLLATRIAWLGSPLAVAVGCGLIVAVSLTIRGRSPCVVDVGLQAGQMLAAGLGGLVFYGRTLARVGPRVPRLSWINYVLPLAALVLFGGLFVLANPDLAESFGNGVESFFRWQADWFSRLSENWLEAFFWIATAWIAVGLLRPVCEQSFLTALFRSNSGTTAENELATPSPLYAAIRNTLVAVSVLFTVYLVFEFSTLWFREFPQGFHYSGYAHEGAAWLTAALALATLALSLIFRGRLLRDPRVARLRGLAWLWSALNFILALSVYHRMYIYIDFNGMTRMRVVGLLGISAVVVGFALVMWKIRFNRDFAWLLRRQLWTLAAAVYAFVLIPVDTIVHSYNVRQILAGDVAPSVQISVHPNSSEGVLVLSPLLHCEDKIIRDGVRAMLAERAIKAEAVAKERDRLGWTTYQLADRMLLDQLRSNDEDWSEFRDDSKRAAALYEFHKYAYQWY